MGLKLEGGCLYEFVWDCSPVLRLETSLSASGG